MRTILLHLSRLTFPFSEQDGLLECKAKQIVYPWQRVEVENRLQSKFWCEWRVSSPPSPISMVPKDYTWITTPGRGLLWDKVFRKNATSVFTVGVV